MLLAVCALRTHHWCLLSLLPLTCQSLSQTLSVLLNGSNSAPSPIKVSGKINNRFINVFSLNFVGLREDLNKQENFAFIEEEEEDRVIGVFV